MRGLRIASRFRLVGLWLLVLFASAALVPWSHPDPTDEVEWTAISILHWQQLTRGGPPAGLEFEDEAARAAGPWRSGAQRTLFGFPSANLPKLVWGAVLDAAGERAADAIVFDTFEHRDPARGARASRELERAVGIARLVTFAAFGLAGALLALFARELVPGPWGWGCAAIALVLWLATPAVRDAATFVRGDWFMVAGTFATLLAALRLRPAIAGERGARAALRAGAVLGLACGLTVAAKLNGVFVVPVVLAWAAAARRRAVPRSGRTFAAALALLAATSVLTFVLLHPYLWGNPVGAVEALFERWNWMREFLRRDWSLRAGLIAPRGFGEGLELFVLRLCGRDDPWRALTTLPLRPFLLPLALVGVLGIAWRAQAAALREGARLLALAMLVVGLGTAAWLPIDWPRYWLPALALACVLEARAVLELGARWGRARVQKRSAPQVPPS